MSAIADWNEYKKLLSPKVSKYLTPVVWEELPTKHIYHLSTNPEIPVFIPQVSARTVDGEDVRVPRVCTACDLLACLLGYGGMWGDYYNSDKKKSSTWTIYEFSSELAFKPKKELLPDQEETNEYWLITYNQNTREYKPKVIGSLTLVAYASARVGKSFKYSLGFVVNAEKPLWLHETVEVQPGKWFFNVSGWQSVTDYDKLKTVPQSIDDKTYEKLIAGKIDLLPSLIPESANW